MTFQFREVRAREILDSRGRPTLAVRVRIGTQTVGVASVPSGASTGRREAVERRDGDRRRYQGAGVLSSVATIQGEIAELLRSTRWSSLAEVDVALIELDGTPNRSRLGGNAIVGVSMAVARALAAVREMPLCYWLADGRPSRLPVPHFNVLNGGTHAATSLEFQEFMIAPLGARSLPEAIRAGAEIYAALRVRLRDRGLSTGLGDEGGFAPELTGPEQACELLVEAIAAAGYEPSLQGVAVALDPAANGFADRPGGYRIGAAALSTRELIERYAEMVDRFPIWSIEDGLAEDDQDGWAALTAQLGDRVQIVGDDLLVTDPAAIRTAAARKLATAALIKPNQVGTVTETLDALQACRDERWGAMVSHRSGETMDTFIADLAVGCGCGQLKSGAPARGERVAKYNRLLEIDELSPGLPYGLPPTVRPITTDGGDGTQA
jgi:enolase